MQWANIVGVAGLILASAGGGRAQDEPDAREVRSPALAAAAADLLATADLILETHPEPPTRQEMWLQAVRRVLRERGAPTPDGLALQVSQADDAALQRLLIGAWLAADDSKPIPDDGLFAVALGGLLGPVPGGAEFLTESESRARDQFAANQYVGVGVAVKKADGGLELVSVLEGGACARAGIPQGAVVLEIDGQSLADVDLQESVAMLRGPQGSSVELKVRFPQQADARTVAVTRAVVPLVSLRTLTLPLEEGRLALVVGLNQLSTSVPHELRQAVAALDDQCAGVVLDLRSQEAPRGVHAAVMLADSLLDEGIIGRSRASGRVREYRAAPGDILKGLPVAVLVDERTAGPAEWLAAALADNGRAVLIGSSTAGRGWARADVKLPGDRGALELATTILLRGDGSPLDYEQLAALSIPGLQETSGRGRLTPAEEVAPPVPMVAQPLQSVVVGGAPAGALLAAAPGNPGPGNNSALPAGADAAVQNAEAPQDAAALPGVLSGLFAGRRPPGAPPLAPTPPVLFGGLGGRIDPVLDRALEVLKTRAAETPPAGAP